MTIIYNQKFDELKEYSLRDVEKLSGKILKAVLYIDSRGVKHKLTLENPTVPAMPSTTVKDLFDTLTSESVDSFQIFGKQYDSDVLWQIEIWKNGSPLVGHTIHCRKIQGLPNTS